MARKSLYELPGPKGEEFLELSRRYEPRSMSEQAPVVWRRAEGVWVEDVDGNRYLDFSSGVLVTNVGHCHPDLIEAVREAAEHMLNCYDFVNPWRVLLAKKLVEITPDGLDKAFILTTGAEAIEAAVKMARRATGNYEVFSFHGAFHGRTLATLSYGGKKSSPGSRGFGPFLPGVIQAPYPYCYRCPFGKERPDCSLTCLEFVDWVYTCEGEGRLCAVLIEPYEGAAGSLIPPAEFVRGLYQWAKEKGALFIDDEVQASFGRTGRMFCFEHFGIVPDLLCLGKGIASGVPCSAVVGAEWVMNSLSPGSLSSTYGGNPLSSRAALASIEIIERERLWENAAKVGKAMMQRLKEWEERHEVVGEARGMGLAIGVEVVRDKRTKEPAPDLAKAIIMEAARRGLVMIAPIGFYGNVLRIAPPLIITEEEAMDGLDRLEDALKAVERGRVAA